MFYILFNIVILITVNHIIIRLLPTTYIDGFHDAEAVSKMEYRRLGKTDMNVSVVGFGMLDLRWD